MGRRPIPPERHVVRGTWRADRHAAPADGVERCAPPAPATVMRDSHALAQWERLVPRLEGMGVLTLAEETALEVHCLTFAEWSRCQEHLEANGPSYEFETGGGQIVRKEYPEALRWKQLLPIIGQQLAKFGLTPVDRAAAKPGKVEAKDKPEDFFSRYAG